MRITIEPTEGPYDFAGSDAPEFQHPKTTIELKDDDLDLSEVVEFLIKPALKGFGFLEEGVDQITSPESPDLFDVCEGYTECTQDCCNGEKERLEKLHELFGKRKTEGR